MQLRINPKHANVLETYVEDLKQWEIVAEFSRYHINKKQLNEIIAISAAAPDLLKALRRILAEWDKHPSVKFGLTKESMDAMAEGKRAVAEATERK